MEKKKIILLILVILWMGVIFFLSSMDAKESTSKSKKTIESGINKTVKATNKYKITNVSNKKSKELAEKLNYPLRKVAHATEYGILAILLVMLLEGKNKKYIITLIFTFLYACSDEFHQSFTGRTSLFKDVLIDTIGAIVFILIFYLIEKKRVKRNEEV